MTEFAIRVDNLSKQYRIGSKLREYNTLRDTLKSNLSTLGRRLVRRQARNDSSSIIWALKEVSFEVAPGEVVGIVGRNGAGKTTLLNILSRITEPTEGRAEIHGRIASLLEVGTGFHPELTGSENIYLNGAILGMKKQEIDARFDEIVDFAEIEKFLQTPVKHYSSGMYMRLAFAVAAHMEQDIMLVDEVLAVGDAAFQRKCLGKMSEVARKGRTVLFVSHNMAAVIRLCERGLFLEQGRLVASGSIEKVVMEYHSSAARRIDDKSKLFATRAGSGRIRFRDVAVTNENGDAWFYSGCTLNIRMTLDTQETYKSPMLRIGVGINGTHGERLITLLNKFDPVDQARVCSVQTGTIVECTVPQLPLKPGIYYLTFYVDINDELADMSDDTLQLEIHSTDYFKTGTMPTGSQGPFLVKQCWSYKKAEETDSTLLSSSSELT